MYLELLKPRFHSNPDEEDSLTESEKKVREEDRQVAREVLYTCLDWSLRLMHPLLPYLTEELYQRLPPSPTKVESIVKAPYPTHVMAWINHTIEKDMEVVAEVASKLRSQKQSLGMNTSAKPKAFVRHGDPDRRACLAKLTKPLSKMSMCGEVSVLQADDPEPKGVLRDVVNDKCLIFMSAEGVNLSAELVKLQKKEANAEKTVQSYEAKMNMPNYTEKVPEAVRQQNAEKLAAAKTECEELKRSVASIQDAMK